MKTRFPLTRINQLALQGAFGLQWDPTNVRWNYVGASGTTLQSSIKTLATVASENREPDFFEVLKAVITNGSVGLGSGSATLNTFVASEPKYYNTTGGLSADFQIMQIGANIIDTWDPDNIPTFVNFQQRTSGGRELPYLKQ